MGKDPLVITIMVLISIIICLSAAFFVDHASAGLQWVRGVTGQQCYLRGFEHGNITKEKMLAFATHELCMESIGE